MDIDKSVKAIGYFQFDHEADTITLTPGIYTLHKPLTFALSTAAKIEDVECRSLTSEHK